MNATGGGGDGDGELREGFICPICMVDQGSHSRLITHFEEQHSTEDKDVIQAFRGMLTKAKKVFLNEDEPDTGSSLSGVTTRRFNNDNDESIYQTNNPWNWDIPPQGPSRNHTAMFKKIRSGRIDSSVAETNKLLIRLDKLLRDLPSDPVKRKVHERSVVMWADDKDVPLCPFCAKSFNLARRRHHCRLCGGIMCDNCSHFITLEYAKKLVSPVHRGDANKLGVTNDGVAANIGGSSGGLTSLLPAGLRRSGSQGSLNSILSVVDSITPEQHFRTCYYCTNRLKVRDNQMEQLTSKPTLTLYYDKLMEYKHELEELIPQYIRMAESLRSGETTHALRDAEDLRVRILKKGDRLKTMAQKIYILTPSPSDDAAGVTPQQAPRQELLQRRIHSTSSVFLKENILSLPKLPTVQELKELQERRRVEVEAQLAAKKEAARQAEARAAEILRKRDNHSNQDSPSSSSSSSHNRSSSYTPPSFASLKKAQQPKEFVVDTGWGADHSTAHNVTETDDPLIQQINIIRNTLKQARLDGRFDDVPLLEANLRELQEEYKKHQRLMNP